MDMERIEMDTETDDPNDDELNNTTQETEINPEHYYMCKELPQQPQHPSCGKGQ